MLSRGERKGWNCRIRQIYYELDKSLTTPEGMCQVCKRYVSCLQMAQCSERLLGMLRGLDGADHLQKGGSHTWSRSVLPQGSCRKPQLSPGVAVPWGHSPTFSTDGKHGGRRRLYSKVTRSRYLYTKHTWEWSFVSLRRGFKCL